MSVFSFRISPTLRLTPLFSVDEQPKATKESTARLELTQDSHEVIKLELSELKQLRFSQATMKDETRDGVPLEELENDMREDGYDERYPIRAVYMPRGKMDSPVKMGQRGKLVTYDNRRGYVARKLAKMSEAISAFAEIKLATDLAGEEYEQLKHLTFVNQKVPKEIRAEWIPSWNYWHQPDVLQKAGILPKTWGHLIKLRMAMSADPVSRLEATQNAGFIVSPQMRKSQKTSSHPNPQMKRKIDFDEPEAPHKDKKVRTE